MSVQRVSWNNLEDVPDPQCRDVEDQVEMRRRNKRLVDCQLPDFFRLVTPQPRQYWINQQMRYCFELEFLDYDHLQGYRFVARYHDRVPDEAQMRWALEDFRGELIAAGVRVGDIKEFLPTPQTTPRLNVPASKAHRGLSIC